MEKKNFSERVSRYPESFILTSVHHPPVLDCVVSLSIASLAASVLKACHENCTTEELGNGDSKAVNYKLKKRMAEGVGAESPFSHADVMK